MTTLTVSATTDFSATALNNIDIIDFTNVAAATATFLNTQFNGTAIHDDVSIDGSAGANHIVVNGGSIDASGWTFVAGWSAPDSVTLNGINGADTMVGSAQDDTINAGLGSDTITGGLGADDLNGGANDDTFVYNAAAELASGESIDGGNGT